MRCPGCAAEISVLRDTCPHCGTSTDSVFDKLQQSDEPSPHQMHRNRKRVLAIGGGILVLLAVSGKIHTPFGHFSFPQHVHVDTRRVTNEAVTIGAPELFEAYHTNSDAADRRFGDRQMIVTGQFVRTVPDGYGSIDMRLKTNHPETPLGIDLDNHSVDAATKLVPGQMVTVSCQHVAGTGDDPWLQDCVLQPNKAADSAASTPAATTPGAAPAAPAPPAPPRDEDE